MHQLVAGRAVPIRIEAQERDLRRRAVGDGRLHIALDEMQLVFGIAGRRHIGAHFAKRGMGPFVVALALKGLPARDLLHAVLAAHIDTFRLGHAGEGVVEVDVARPLADRLQGERDHHGAAAAPHAAFHHGAGHAALSKIFDRAVERVHAFDGGQRVAPRTFIERNEFRLHIVRYVQRAAVAVILRDLAQGKIIAETEGELAQALVQRAARRRGRLAGLRSRCRGHRPVSRAVRFIRTRLRLAADERSCCQRLARRRGAARAW